MFAPRRLADVLVPVFAGLAVFAAFASPSAGHADPAVFVSADHGDDSQPCTLSQPCRTFRRALDVVDKGGTVTAIDTGRYDEDFIDVRFAVSLIAAPGVRAELTSKNSGISVNASPGDVVAIRNLALVGRPDPPNNAIVFNGGDALHVEDCVVSGWPTKGILALGVAGRVLHVKNSLFRDNGFGVAIDGPVIGSIEGSHFEHNGYGVSITVNGRATVKNSVASGNATVGFLASGYGAANQAELVLEDVSATGNGTAVRAEGFASGKGVVWISTSTASQNAIGLRVGGSGTIYSRGNNTVAGNTTDVSGVLTGWSAR
jgi:hypothetical protein